MKKQVFNILKMESDPILGQRYVGTEERTVVYVPRVPRKSKKRRTQRFF